MITGNEPIAVTHFRDGEVNGEGLTIRQHFAAMAMQGAVSNTEVLKCIRGKGATEMIKIICQDSVLLADGLIDELNKTNN